MPLVTLKIQLSRESAAVNFVSDFFSDIRFFVLPGGLGEIVFPSWRCAGVGASCPRENRRSVRRFCVDAGF